MRINFDNIALAEHISPRITKQSPIKLQVETPYYDEVVRQLDPSNYSKEIHTINVLMNWPQEVSRFIEKEVEKEILGVDEQVEGQCSSVAVTQSKNNSIIQNQHKMSFFTHNNNKCKYPLQTMKTAVPKIKQGYSNNFKKHKCCQNLTTQTMSTMSQLHQLTSQPSLCPSSVTKKIEQKRKQKVNYNSNYSVHDNLYRQALQRKFRKESKRQQQIHKMNSFKPYINKKYSGNFKQEPIFKRLNKILEMRERNRMQKYQLNETQNRKMFELDLSLSRQSYKIYANSLSKEKNRIKIPTKQIKVNPNIKLKKGVIKKQQIRTQRVQSVLDLTKTLQTSRLKQNPFDAKTIQYFTQILYPQTDSCQGSLKTSSASNPIRKQQFLILHNFLHQIEQIQNRKNQMQMTTNSQKYTQSSKVSKVLPKKDFQQKFKKYYEKLNLHDREILRKQIVKKNKKTQFTHNQSLLQENLTFKPRINVRSSSLDDLAQGHTKKIYYV